MRFAVTGANGMIGKSLVLRLAAEGHQVLAIYRSNLPSEFLDHENISLATGDVRDRSFLDRALVDIDGVFHVAAFAKPWAKDSSIYYEVNEQGTKNVCKACLKNGVKRLVYTASAGIHGPQQNGQLIDEHTWPETYHTDYEQSKFNGMQAALAFAAKGLEVNAVSPARVYAPGEVTESNVPMRMVEIYLKRGIGVAPTNGRGVGSYVYIDDVVSGHILAMTTPAHGEEYLIGGENLNYLEFFKTLSELTGKRHPIITVPFAISLLIGKVNLFLAETIGIQPVITTPWVRRYRQHWGVNSTKISTLGLNTIPLKSGLKTVLKNWNPS
ncbi:MAG: NAD-dependent epimerase/dehydratase family protein [Salibacteraceae bacterium]